MAPTIKDPLSYPLLGLLYLIAHPSMMCSILLVAIFGIFLCIATLIVFFMFTLKPQAMYFSSNRGLDDDGNVAIQWYSWLFAIISVLIEATIVSFLLLKCLHAKCKIKLFIATLTNEKQWKTSPTQNNNQQQQPPEEEENNGIVMVQPSVGNEIFGCFTNGKKIIGTLIGIITLPMNLIPVVGWLLYAIVNGVHCGWDYMDMYFDVIDLSSEQRKIALLGEAEHRSYCSPMIYIYSNSYARFGITAKLLEMIPIAGPSFFALTNVVGAALWSCDMIQKGGPPLLVYYNNHQHHSTKPTIAVVEGLPAANAETSSLNHQHAQTPYSEMNSHSSTKNS